jgi:hypothetical protein
MLYSFGNRRKIKESIKYIMNLIDLFNQIDHKISSGDNLQDCIKLLKTYDSKDYIHYIKKNENKYHRNVVISNKQIELVIITWSSGQSSGFHGHPGECIFKVLENSINEEIIKGDLRIEHRYNPNNIGYIDNSIGFHNMAAINDTVTLHIYSPPF